MFHVLYFHHTTTQQVQNANRSIYHDYSLPHLILTFMYVRDLCDLSLVLPSHHHPQSPKTPTHPYTMITHSHISVYQQTTLPTYQAGITPCSKSTKSKLPSYTNKYLHLTNLISRPAHHLLHHRRMNQLQNPLGNSRFQLGPISRDFHLLTSIPLISQSSDLLKTDRSSTTPRNAKRCRNNSIHRFTLSFPKNGISSGVFDNRAGGSSQSCGGESDADAFEGR